MKRIKAFSASIAIIAALTILPMAVSAEVQGYYSSLDMSANSCHWGETRHYDKSKHNLEVTVSDKGNGANKVKVSEYYQDIWSTTLKSSKICSYNNIGTTYKNYMGAFGAGDFYYQFDGTVSETGGPSTWYKADTVFMYTMD